MSGKDDEDLLRERLDTYRDHLVRITGLYKADGDFSEELDQAVDQAWETLQEESPRVYSSEGTRWTIEEDDDEQ